MRAFIEDRIHEGATGMYYLFIKYVLMKTFEIIVNFFCRKLFIFRL